MKKATQYAAWALIIDYIVLFAENQAERTFLPLALLAANTFLPLAVLILFLKP